MPTPIPSGQGEPAKCQKWLPSSPDSASGQPPECRNGASSAGGQNAQLRGHWASCKCAPQNCVSRRASKTSPIALPEVSIAPCSRSSRRADEADDAETGAITLLGMGPGLQDLLAQGCGRRADLAGGLPGCARSSSRRSAGGSMACVRERSCVSGCRWRPDGRRCVHPCGRSRCRRRSAAPRLRHGRSGTGRNNSGRRCRRRRRRAGDRRDHECAARTETPTGGIDRTHDRLRLPCPCNARGCPASIRGATSRQEYARPRWRWPR